MTKYLNLCSLGREQWVMGIARHSRDIWASTAWWSRRSWDSGMSTPWTSTCWYGTSSGLACCKNCLFRNIFLGWYVTKYDIILVKKDTKITFFCRLSECHRCPYAQFVQRDSPTLFLSHVDIFPAQFAQQNWKREEVSATYAGEFSLQLQNWFFFLEIILWKSISILY